MPLSMLRKSSFEPSEWNVHCTTTWPVTSDVRAGLEDGSRCGDAGKGNRVYRFDSAYIMAKCLLRRHGFPALFGFGKPAAANRVLRDARQIRLDIENGRAVHHVNAAYAHLTALAPQQL